MFDRIIMGSNDDPTYFGFWRIQVLAHRAYFPDAKLTLALLGSENPAVTEALGRAGVDVHFYTGVAGIPPANQAKLLRYYCAAQFPEETCIVADIDTVPLQRNYIKELFHRLDPDKLLAVGREVLEDTPHEGKVPAHHTAGKGKLFEHLYNTEGKSFAEVVVQHAGSMLYDGKEDVRNNPLLFSDESLNRALIEKFAVPVKYTTRDIDIRRQWIDRAWWSEFNVDRLYTNQYVEANLLRPFMDYREEIQPIVDYLEIKSQQSFKEL